MKRYAGIALGVVICLALAAAAYVWVVALMDSLDAYRSPLHASPPAPGEPLGLPATRRVVFVLVDALREDTSLRREVMPFLNDLRDSGAWATMHSRPPSYSMPSYTVLLTGVWPDLSDGPALNRDYADTPTFTQDDLFSAAHRAGLTTAVSGYNWFEKLIPPSAVDAAFYTPGEDRVADRAVVDAALPWLRDGGYQLVLIHLDQVDYAGHHEGGPLDPRWDEAARRADDLLREIAATLDLSQDTLFVCSDHGQIDRGGHGGTEAVVLTEPFVLAGAGVRPGRYGDVAMVDVAPTLAALLGASIPASSQGHVRTEMLALDEQQEDAVQRALQAQQAALLTAYGSAIGRPTAAAPGDDVVAAHQSALQAARAARLAAERLPRALLALALAVAPSVLLIRRRRDAAWWLAGAVLTAALFHLRYALLDRMTYSLSSLVGANELILYVAVTVAIALTLGWLAASLGSGAFRRPPRLAAAATLGFVLTTVYLLALPVLLSLALNGATVTWTLPDFVTMFLAFLSLIQILFVAALGPLLTGLAALIAAIAG